MGGRGSGSRLESLGVSEGGGASISLINNSSTLKSQVQDAKANGYKSARVDEMISEAKANGWKETYPSYNTSTDMAYRTVATKGSGSLSNRQAAVHVTENTISMTVTDGNKGGEYRFSNINDAIASGNRFVSIPKASTKSSGPKDSEFLVGSGRPR